MDAGDRDAGSGRARPSSAPTSRPIGWIGGPGTSMAAAQPQPGEPRPDTSRRYRPIVFALRAEARPQRLSARLGDRHERSARSPISSPSMTAHADRALRFGQDMFLAAEATRGDLVGARIQIGARAWICAPPRTLGLDAYMDAHRLDAVLFPARAARRSPPRRAIRASRCRPGSPPAVGGEETPDYPIGATFTGRAWSEPMLLRLAYAYEQASKARRPPPGLPPLGTGCSAD